MDLVTNSVAYALLLLMGSFEDMDDRDLLVAAKHDREAFAVFYRRHVEGVLTFFYRSVPSADVALDLTAETFAAVLLALPSYRPGQSPGRAWLYVIAHHRLVNSLRRGQAEARAREQLGMQALRLSPTGEEEIQRIVNRAEDTASRLVRALPEPQRDAITARFIDGLDYADIARSLSCSEQVVRQRVSRGLAALRQQLGGAL